jgi:hypothetical protein
VRHRSTSTTEHGQTRHKHSSGHRYSVPRQIQQIHSCHILDTNRYDYSHSHSTFPVSISRISTCNTKREACLTFPPQLSEKAGHQDFEQQLSKLEIQGELTRSSRTGFFDLCFAKGMTVCNTLLLQCEINQYHIHNYLFCLPDFRYVDLAN